MSEENINEETNNEEVTEDVQGEEEKSSKEKPSLMAVLSYLGILVLIPLLAAKEDEFAQYHAKQGLVLLIAGVIGMFVGAVPIIGWILAPFISLAWLIFSIIGIVNVLGGKKKELPIIGQYAKNFKM